jgi:polyisoprenoid-binding protein YceI
MKAITLALLGLASVVAYSYLKPPPQASESVKAVALEQAPASHSPSHIFEIVPEESEARFVIDEVLRGTPKTVVGTTDQIAGQIALDLGDLDTVQVGTILINARTFVTDNTQRDRAIQNQVLQTAQHEYIVFSPPALLNLPESASPAQAVSLQLLGELTIGGVAREVAFDGTFMPQYSDRLEGTASTTIRYADWGIIIPQVPAVANVSDTVRLELDVVARAA